MNQDVRNYCKYCHKYQIVKVTNKKKYGLLPKNLGKVVKCSQVNVNFWRPKSIKNKNSYKYKFHVITMVDPVTGFLNVTSCTVDRP